MRTLLAAAVLVICSCDPSHTWIEVGTGGFSPDTYEIEWPQESGEYVTVNNLLTDSAGLAGLRVEVFAPGEPPVVLTADTFAVTHNHVVGPFRAPDSGTASVFVKLYQSGELVTEGSISWSLRPESPGWLVQVERSPFPAEVHPDDLSSPEPLCAVPWCHKVRRFEIGEDARNYPVEALWLAVWVSGW